MSNLADLIGAPFVDGGRDPETGLDCWGLAMEVFRRYGIQLPDYRIGCLDETGIDDAAENSRSAWVRCERDAAPVPCLLAIRFNNPKLINHTGVYLGAGRFIHTMQKVGVNISRVDDPAWRHMIEGFYIPKGGTK